MQYKYAFSGNTRVNVLCYALLNALPLWLFSTVVTQDGGAHLYNARVLADWFSGQNADFYRYFYQINTAPSPNWLAELFLAALLYLGISAAVAEKILLTLYALALPLSVSTALRVISPKRTENSYWTLPLVFNFTLFYGFYNFCLSLPIAFFSIAFLWQYFYKTSENLATDALGKTANSNNSIVKSWFSTSWFSTSWFSTSYFSTSFIFLNILLLLTYFSHPIAWLIVLGMGVAIFLANYSKKRTFSFPLILSFLPTIVLFLLFSQNNSVSFFEWKIRNYPLLQWVFGWQSGCGFEGSERFIFYALGLVFWGIIAWHVIMSTVAISRKIQELKGLQFRFFYEKLRVNAFLPIILLIPFLLFLYLFAPDATAGGAYLTVRISYFILIFAIFLLPKLKYAHFIPIIAAFSLWGLRYNALHKADTICQTVAFAGKQIAPRSVVLPLIYDKYGHEAALNPKMYLLKHIAARLGTEKPLILLDNYEAATNYFPLKWNDNCNSFTQLGKPHGIDDDTPEVDIAAYEKSAHCSIDYILTVGVSNRSFSNYVRCNFLGKTAKTIASNIINADSNYVMLYRKIPN